MVFIFENKFLEIACLNDIYYIFDMFMYIHALHNMYHKHPRDLKAK